MARRVLNDRVIRALKPAPKGKRVILWDAVVPGFGIRSTDKNHSYVLVRRLPGAKHPAPRTIAAVGAIELPDARKKARQWLELIERGIDPSVKEAAEAEAQRVETLRRTRNTHRVVWDQYVALRLSQTRDCDERKRLIEREAMPHLEALPFDAPEAVIRRHVAEIANRTYLRGARYVAARIHKYLSPFYSWGQDQGYRDGHPLARFRGPLAKEEKRERVLSDEEVLALWRACGRLGEAGGAKINAIFGGAVRFLLVTLARRDEAGSMAQSELEGATWTLPAERSKNGKARVLPLPPLAQRVLEETPRIGDSFVFTTGGERPISGWGWAKRALDAAMLEELRKIAAQRGEDPAKAKLTPWRLHDLRRTGATGLGKLGFSDHVIRQALGHTDARGVLGVYERSDRTEEVAAALAAWGRRLEGLIAGDGGKVVPLRRSRKR
jgi:integrase